MLKGTVNIPFINKKVPILYLVVGVGIVVLYMYYRKKQNDTVDAVTSLTRGLNVGSDPFVPLQQGELRTDTGTRIKPLALANCHCPKGYHVTGQGPHPLCKSIAGTGLTLPCNKPDVPEAGYGFPPGVGGVSKYAQLKI